MGEHPLNYRHHFHAGNFADVMKHAILLELIAAMRRAGPVRLVETHAGAGLYDLEGEMAARSSEAEGGVGRLMAAGDAPRALKALKAAVAAENPDGRLQLYPGSPVLAAGALGGDGRYVGCELRPDDYDSLRRILAERSPPNGNRSDRNRQNLHPLHPDRRVQLACEAKLADGYAALPGLLRGGELVVIDPPYERGDEYDQVERAVALAIAKGAGAAVWAPIKDLETLDGMIRRLEALRPRTLVLAEVRIRPLTNPMSMNGSVMALVNTADVSAEAGAVCDWVAAHCGEAGAKGGASRIVG